jgi:hypothetical protein
MPTKPTHHACPFADKVEVAANGIPHIEGRFSALETEVSALKSGLDDMQRSVAEGFKTVFSKIDSIGSARSAATLPWIGMMIVILGMASTQVYTIMSGQSEDIRDVKLLAVQDLKDINSRLYSSQYERGIADAKAAEFAVKIQELDIKLQNETKLTAERIGEQIKALDDKLQIEQRLVSETNRNQMDEQKDYATEMRAWRLEHVKEMAYSEGEQDAKIQAITDEQDRIEQRQYVNTGSIGEIKAQVPCDLKAK